MKSKILIVDDETYILNILDFSLDSEGFEVVTAADGEQALFRTDELQPDLIILDIMMPKLDGFEVCRAIKAKPETKDIPVILLSAKDSEKDKRKGKEAGCDRYMTKPFSPMRLIQTVQELLGSRQPD